MAIVFWDGKGREYRSDPLTFDEKALHEMVNIVAEGGLNPPPGGMLGFATAMLRAFLKINE